MMGFYNAWQPYVSVAKRRASATREMRKLQKQGKRIEPITIEGRKIARTFWGNAWCEHLEQFSDYANRLPRGRTYVRNGSVCHLSIAKGKIEAIVSGSQMYNVNVIVQPLAANKWRALRHRCAGQIGSMLELLQGKLSNQIMAVVTDRSNGLFPQSRDIKFSCDCPDWARMCKHVAAVLYGIGARFDHHPELLFLLRNVDHETLISTKIELRTQAGGKANRRHLVGQDLSAVFGVEIDSQPTPRRKKTSNSQNASAPPCTPIAPKKTKAPARSEPISRQNRRNRPATTTKKVAVTSVFRPSATAIARLRKRFGLNRAQFAQLLGVSPPTVAHWENSPGKLMLRKPSLLSLNRAAKLTALQVTRKLTQLRQKTAR